MKKLCCLLGLAALLLPAQSVLAVRVVDTSPVPDAFTVYDEKHSIFAQFVLTEAHEKLDGAGGVHRIGIPGLADPRFALTKVLEYPGSTWASDVFGIARFSASDGLPAGFYLAFTSDTETAQAGFARFASTTVIETLANHGVFDATSYLSKDYRSRGYTAEFYSHVPDGGFTAGMLGLGLVGLASLRQVAKK